MIPFFVTVYMKKNLKILFTLFIYLSSSSHLISQTIAAGSYHTVLLDKDGHLWTFGNGYYGQLGHGDTANQLVPKQVKEIPKIAVSAIDRFNKTKSASNI